MQEDLTFALLFNFPGGHIPALEALETQLPGAIQSRGALVYRGNVLKFGKSPLCDGDGELQCQISVFPLDRVDQQHQRNLLQEIFSTLCGVVGEVAILADDALLK